MSVSKLKTAATRVMRAQAQRNIKAGNLLPQSQNAIGEYVHAQIGKNINLFGNPEASLPNTLNVWATGFINHLFAKNSFTDDVLPSFQWKILNYGRVVNNIRGQDAGLQQWCWNIRKRS